MRLNPSDLEAPRTPSELREFVERVRADVRANRDEFALGMTKRGLYKEFLDEVLALCDFAEAEYPPDHTVRLVLGNQGYDALVYDLNVNEVDRLEFARPHDGQFTSESAKRVVAVGVGLMQAPDHDDPLGSLYPSIDRTAQSKSQKDYGGVTVVFSLPVPPPLASIAKHFNRQVEEIRALIARNRFKAKRVVLFVPPGRVITVQDL
ncbi:MAG TPA: hypothetical protein VHM00_17970 [Caldimonas sp.]|jgi:hypothetical protein|nr:hypothetical protein [Caldimonas sp.]HEX2542955.1 hypothetical protein [Caldimonas sp.]